MFLTRLKITASIVVTASILAAMVIDALHSEIAAADAAKPNLTANPTPEISPEQFSKLRELIKPKPGGFDDVRWMTDLWEARKKAAAEGKPLLVWVGDGHPLGWT